MGRHAARLTPLGLATTSLSLGTSTEYDKICEPGHLCAKLAPLFYMTNLSIHAANSGVAPTQDLTWDTG